LEALRSVNPPSGWKILVVDEYSQRLLGAVLKQFDILAERVTCTSVIWTNPQCASLTTSCQPVIESITSIREPQPEFEAMYILMPTTQNVERIIKDFSNHKQYAAAHLFFTEGARVLADFHWRHN
jgi:syntaxin-binding protein 1